MKFRAKEYVNCVARMISQVAWNHRLPSAGIACLGLALVGFGGLTPAQPQERVKYDDQNTRYTIQDLGVVGANFFQPGQPFVISNSGRVSGGAGVGAAEHAVLWRGGEMTDIGNPGLGGNSIAFGVNVWGHAVGEAEDTAGDLSTTEDFCGFEFMAYTSSPTPCVPFIWKEGKMVPLKTLGGANGVANQINNFGVIAGYAENTTKDPGCPSPQIYQFKPVVWFRDWIQPLPTEGTDPEGVAFSINDRGQVVGASGTCAAFNPNFLFNFQPVHALLWQNGIATDLGNLLGASSNFAHDINNRGEVVGGSGSLAFLWTPEKMIQSLGVVDTDIYSVALGINDKGQVVGASLEADGVTLRAFVRQVEDLVDLNTRIAGSNPFPEVGLVDGGLVPTGLVTACSINSRGEIIGIAVDPTGTTHAYLAIPTPAT
jgi:probable HAF family extracellular repeat protein